MRILLVEDDAELGSGVCASLKREHYAVDWVTDGPSASTALSTGQYDLVILELGLPKMSGLQVLRQLRSRGEAQKAVPVLITALPNRSASVIHTHGPTTLKPHCTWRPSPGSVSSVKLKGPGASSMNCSLNEE